MEATITIEPPLEKEENVPFPRRDTLALRPHAARHTQAPSRSLYPRFSISGTTAFVIRAVAFTLMSRI